LENNGDTGKTVQGHPSKNVENEGIKNIVSTVKSVFSDQFSEIKKTNISEKFGEFKNKNFKIVNFHLDRYFSVFLCAHVETDVWYAFKFRQISITICARSIF